MQKYDVPLGAIWFGLSRICVEQHCADNTNEIADETSRGRAVEGASPYNNVVWILKIVQKKEKNRKTLIYGQVDYMYGEAFYKPEMKEGNPIRLYSLDEITEIFCKLGLRICNSFADFSGKPSSDNDIQLMVYSIRE